MRNTFTAFRESSPVPSNRAHVDAVLRRVASLLSQEMRGTDLLARWGGEEFIALLPDVDLRGAMARAERMRRAAADDPAHLTISVGVSSCPDDGADVVSLIRLSDEALFAAKRGGRDRVVAHQQLAALHAVS